MGTPMIQSSPERMMFSFVGLPIRMREMTFWFPAVLVSACLGRAGG